ncbi:hypothetical protein GA0116948_11940 [Chitinophaga costaii]|uniref:Uncharacterized protein n=1 Tax=Chitinophaga costaii TaxID=1335309 RepID=A0A1C4G1S2_9BACT|nr:hypothetical protein [Chitinophaga costaii]PUZ19948.1 hypothetical protein DCM91_19835 [Chitinophaga costaii]SCC61825.1 hypothetical protein GA0116948_11940 [Chitinophaga costaii]
MDPFLLKFEYEGTPHIITVTPQVSGYTTSFVLTVSGVEVRYEADEEGYLRAIAKDPSQKNLPEGLLHEVGIQLIQHLNTSNPA